MSHRECGQFCPYVHENFEKFEMISTSMGSWIRSRLFMNIGTGLSTLSIWQSIGENENLPKSFYALNVPQAGAALEN